MIVRVFDGNTDTILNGWPAVSAVTLYSNGAITLHCPVINAQGTQIIQLEPSANKIEIVRAYNEE